MEGRDLVGVTVEHKIFGQGVVESAWDNYIEVTFIKNSKRCKFSYPSCFQEFLKLTTNEKQTDVETDLEKWKIESGAEKKEVLREQYIKTQRGIEARRIAAEEKKLRAAQRTMNRNHYKSQKNDEEK